MPNKEENIDRFVKKVVEHYDVQYDDSHWTDLEKKLDTEMPVVASPGSSGSFSTIVISVLSGMVIMLGILWGFNGLDFLADSDQDPVISSDVPGEATNSQNTVNDNSDDAVKKISGSGPIEPPAQQVIGGDDGRSEGKAVVLNLNEDGNEPAIAVTSIQIDNNESVYQRPVLKSFSHPIPIEDYELLDKGQLSLMDDFGTDEVVPKHQKNLFHWGVALSGAPDFNSVGIQSDKEASWQLGGQLVATYKERISLTTGVLYNKKRYTTQGEDYYPPVGYWKGYTNGVIPDEVYGYCVVLDIPINLSYNWNPHKRLQFLSTIGVSNYFILGEDYHYRFFNGNPGAAEGWDTEEMTRQMFGVGNLSVGILWYVKPKIGIKVEPYLKVPLKEIGWGRVDLYSTGTLLSIHYIFNKK